MRKKHYLMACVVSIAPIVFACSQREALEVDLQDSGKDVLVTEVTGVMPDYAFGAGVKAVSVGDFSWKGGSRLSFTDYTCEYPLGFGVVSDGSHYGVFVGENCGFVRGVTYYATYPTSVVNYSGQVQTENGSSRHLNDYNYLRLSVAVPVKGAAFMKVEQVGSLAQFNLTAPSGVEYKSMDLLIGDTHVASLSLGDGFAAEGTLVLNMMMAPEIKSGDTGHVCLVDKNGIRYSGTFTAESQQVAGKAYCYSLNVSPEGTGEIGLDPVGGVDEGGYIEG